MVDLPDEAREMKDKGQNVEGDMFDRKKPDNQQGQTDEDMSRENLQE
jgi:hypothetical protein